MPGGGYLVPLMDFVDVNKTLTCGLSRLKHAKISVGAMEKQLETIKNEFHALIESLEDNARLSQVRIELFGKNGIITKATKEFANITKEERPKVGMLINEVKQSLEEALTAKELKIRSQSQQSVIDITTPGIRPKTGHLHPITQAIWDIGNIFSRIGFEVTDTREIETDWYAFGALNFPENHPARDEWETFFLETQKI